MVKANAPPGVLTEKSAALAVQKESITAIMANPIRRVRVRKKAPVLINVF
jgi:hypothetical protein